MINRKTFLAIGFLLLFPLDLPAQLVVPASEAEALKGLGMVGVVVDINDDAERLVSENQLKTDVELTLRRNGIVVGMNQQEWMAELAPYVYVNIIDMEMQNTSGVSLDFTTCISLKIMEMVGLTRDSPTIMRAAVWDTAALNAFSNRSSATQGSRQVVRDLVDQFSNDYLAMNPITR